MEVADSLYFVPCFSTMPLPPSYSVAASPGQLCSLNNLFLCDMLTVSSMRTGSNFM
jgi:hypothetical protein